MKTKKPTVYVVIEGAYCECDVQCTCRDSISRVFLSREAAEEYSKGLHGTWVQQHDLDTNAEIEENA